MCKGGSPCVSAGCHLMTPGLRQWSINTPTSSQKLAATQYSGGKTIYTSTDSGATWTNRGDNAGYRYWGSIASSSDGTVRSTAATGTTHTFAHIRSRVVDECMCVYYLPPDNGRSINTRTSSQKLAVVGRTNSYIYTSTDSGATWTEQTNSGARNWIYIASSSNGTVRVQGWVSMCVC
jgi:hypothetical protein